MDHTDGHLHSCWQLGCYAAAFSLLHLRFSSRNHLRVIGGVRRAAPSQSTQAKIQEHSSRQVIFHKHPIQLSPQMGPYAHRPPHWQPLVPTPRAPHPSPCAAVDIVLEVNTHLRQHGGMELTAEERGSVLGRLRAAEASLEQEIAREAAEKGLENS
jgi:hypothetical protein